MEILLKLAWSADDKKLYYPAGSLMEIDLQNKIARPVFDAETVHAKTRVFAIHGELLYYAQSNIVREFLLAEEIE